MAVTILVASLLGSACAATTSVAPTSQATPSATLPAPPTPLPTPRYSFDEPIPSDLPPHATPTPLPTPTLPPQTPVPAATPIPVAMPTAAPWVPTGVAAPFYTHGSRSTPLIALTIDDCYSSSTVLAMLDILRSQGVNATFFPIGEAVAWNPGTWQQVAAAGYPIANHTYTHGSLRLMSYDAAVADIRRATDVVSRITGRPLLPVLRPPGGNWNQAVLVAAAEAGQQAVVNWDVSTGDTGAGSVAQLIANGTRGWNGSIVLMHANAARSAQALPGLISYYRSRGFTFVTLGQMLGIPGAVPFGTGPIPTATPAPTATPTATPIATLVPTPTASPTPAPTPAATATVSPTPTPTPSPSPTPSPTFAPTATPVPTGTPPSPSLAPSESPSGSAPDLRGGAVTGTAFGLILVAVGGVLPLAARSGRRQRRG